MRVNKERLIEHLWDLLMDVETGGVMPTSKIIDECADRILDDIDRGIIAASEEV